MGSLALQQAPVIVHLVGQEAGCPADTLPPHTQTHHRHPVRHRQQRKELQLVLPKLHGRCEIVCRVIAAGSVSRLRRWFSPDLQT